MLHAQSNPKPQEINLLQGEYQVSGDPDMTLTTILGSCVATCMFDPVAGIGGMNHFLLATGGGADNRSLSFGVNAMEMLINGIMRMGGQKDRLQAKLFGGAAMDVRMDHVGRNNAEFAQEFLIKEGIPLAASSLGGTQGRRLRFIPTTGVVSQRLVEDQPSVPTPAPVAAPATDDDDILFFED